MDSPKPVDGQAFLANVRQSGLLDSGRLAAVAGQVADRGSRSVARALVQRGLLTRFQAERLLAGRVSGFILGQYRILDQLGRGGMGRVYKAEHTTMGRLVALKILSSRLVQTARAQELFLREVRAAGRVVHPNLVTAFDAGQFRNRFFLVLEFIDGPNLDQLVRQQGPLSVGLACDFIRQAALGLDHAHQLGLVHRDVKPSNLLVQRGNEKASGRSVIKISDFGLARLHEPDIHPDEALGTILTKANMVMGTPDFLSPEQARNLHNVDLRSDLYSLGCTFYFLLTGQVPFPGGTTVEKVIRHTTEPPTPVTRLRPDVPLPVAAVVHRLLGKAPDDRYPSAAEVVNVLNPFARGGYTMWPTSQSQTPYEDALVTPEVMAESCSEADFELGPASGDANAPGSTILPEPAPAVVVTPLAVPHPNHLLRQRRRLRVILFTVTAIVLFLFASLSWLLSRG
jgi:serine/threonine-protein kinase